MRQVPDKTIHKLENKIQREILSYLDTIPCLYAIKIIVANNRGVPDILCCHKSKFIAFEVKSKWNLTTAIQRYNLDTIIKAGGTAAVVRSVSEVKRILGEVGHD